MHGALWVNLWVGSNRSGLRAENGKLLAERMRFEPKIGPLDLLWFNDRGPAQGIAYADARSRVEHRDELMAPLRPIFET